MISEALSARPNFATIGIVGGMGPHSGVALMSTILNNTKARCDQDYPSTVLMSFPREMADRTRFILGEGKVNPAYGIALVIGKLYAAGATVIGIACNTAYSPEIYNVVLQELERKEIVVTMVNMPMEAYKHILTHYPHARRVGLMTTTGTHMSGVYCSLLSEMGYEVVQPDLDFQNDVIHRMIYDPQFGIKAHPQCIRADVYKLAKRARQFFKQQQTDVIVLGCTELSLALTEEDLGNIPTVDALQALARGLLQHATVADELASVHRYR